jgi:hypothetical protein
MQLPSTSPREEGVASPLIFVPHSSMKTHLFCFSRSS